MNNLSFKNNMVAVFNFYFCFINHKLLGMKNLVNILFK